MVGQARNSRKRISIHTPREGSDVTDKRLGFKEKDFNPHSPRGERLANIFSMLRRSDFNPHSPRGERLRARGRPEPNAIFQSTLPARGATARNSMQWLSTSGFQSTLPARGATPDVIFCHKPVKFPIPWERTDTIIHFNPHSPRGERPTVRSSPNSGFLFQSTLPARGAT
mgnify:CR=1 FL=1